MFTDTHTHLYDEKLMADGQQIEKAIAAGVTRMYMPNCDSNTAAPMLAIADKWPLNCFPMAGLHPTYVKENYLDELATVERMLKERKFAGVGEIGLDYYWDLTFKQQQIEVFEKQIDWALTFNLPIIIHSREATPDCIEIVRMKQNGRLKGIFHCFSGTEDEATQIIDLGFYIGIGGVVTYKKTTLPEIIQSVGLTNVVLETDAPYLAPVPYRGKQNESRYIPVIAQKIGDILGISAEDVGAITTLNAFKIFTIH
ncbi:MAG: TatD family hydrolase [Taibaiella sp.]|nr:TatD family hydrolase [Taibaiella sp.]